MGLVVLLVSLDSHKQGVPTPQKTSLPSGGSRVSFAPASCANGESFFFLWTQICSLCDVSIAKLGANLNEFLLGMVLFEGDIKGSLFFLS